MGRTTGPPRVTRTDVARHAGVSTAVVSYVVNGGPRNVAPRTAERVRSSIEALGYHPDANARALSEGSSRMLGLVVPDLAQPFFAELGSIIESKAGSRGYDILFASSGIDAASQKKNIQDLVARRVDAMIIASGWPDDLADSAAMGVRRILIDQPVAVPGFVAVGTDFSRGVALAVEHLLGHGHETVSLVVGDVNSRGRVDAREVAWGRCLDEAGAPRGRVARTAFTREGGYRAMQKLLASGQHPTALFVSSDLQAVGALRAIHEAGLRIPEDIAVVSFDGSAESEFTWPALTSVRQDMDAIAGLAMTAALDSDANEGITLVPADLVIRDSCGCASSVLLVGPVHSPQ